MFIELEPIFNNIGASVPFDYEMDMSDEEFWAGKPFQKAVRVKGEAVNRAGIVCIEAHKSISFCNGLNHILTIGELLFIWSRQKPMRVFLWSGSNTLKITNGMNVGLIPVMNN